MNVIMESTILMSLPERMFSLPQKADKNSAAAALVISAVTAARSMFFGGGSANTFPTGAAAVFGGSEV